MISADIRPRTIGRPSIGALQPLGQSRAAHTNTGAPASSSGGVQRQAVRPSPKRPGKRRMPSSADRCGPQTKHSGNGWSVSPAYWVVASRAISMGTGGTSAIESSVSVASATIVSSRMSCAAVPDIATSSGVSSGGGVRRVTVAERSPAAVASEPAT